MSTKDPKIVLLQSLPFIQKRGLKRITKLSGGMTNHSYLVQTETEALICRFGPANMEVIGLDKDREIWNTNKAFGIGIGPQVLAYYKKHNLLINTYIPGKVITKRQGHSKKIIKEFARVLSILHAHRNFKGIHNLGDVGDKQVLFLKKNNALSTDLAKACTLARRLRKRTSQLVSCHVDLMRTNILVNKGNVHFIDWEYSAKSDPMVDIAALSLELEWSAQEEKYFLSHYPAKKPILISGLAAGKCIFALREALWGAVQHVVVPEQSDYMGYVAKHLQIFNRLIKQVL